MVSAPLDIKLLQKSRIVEITFEDGKQYSLPCEYLRVYSPSAEVKGHGNGNSKLETGKRNINIISIQPVGNYAVKLVFDDGHSSGLYSWETLYDLAVNYDTYWQTYLDKLTAAHASRDS